MASGIKVRVGGGLTASSSLGVKMNLSASRRGTMKTTKKGKTSAACVDFTIQRMANPMPWQRVNRCIFRVRTWFKEKLVRVVYGTQC